ncbi:hypothetical protein [Nocardioides aequoreus]|nr:hypothetical protein [Nocardioides aequoreus]
MDQLDEALARSRQADLVGVTRALRARRPLPGAARRFRAVRLRRPEEL